MPAIDFVFGWRTPDPHRSAAALPLDVLRLGVRLASRRNARSTTTRVAGTTRDPQQLRRSRRRTFRLRRPAVGSAPPPSTGRQPLTQTAAAPPPLRHRAAADPACRRPTAATGSAGRCSRATAAAVPAPQVAKVSHEAEQEADDRRSATGRPKARRGRIVTCGTALCGYVLNSIIRRSRRSGADQHEAERRHALGWQRLQPRQRQHLYGTIELKGAEHAAGRSLRAGRFYCSGNDWSRVPRARRQR